MVSQIPEISIIIVGYNSKKYLESCLDSIQHQSIFKSGKIETIFIENGSFDGSVELIRRSYKWVNVVRNMKNVGFAAALNQGIRYSRGDFVLLMNHDVILDKDYLENAIKVMIKEKKLAALMGKIYQYDFNRSQQTRFFDTVGIFAMVDREILSGRGAEDLGQFEEYQEIFSVRNICAFYRKSALEDIKVYDEYFDENFFLYLEDIDCCWRFHLFGWKVAFAPGMTAYHMQDKNKLSRLKEYKKTERRYFIINDRLMTLKNAFILNLLYDAKIVFRKRFYKNSFIKEKWLGGLFCYLRQIPTTLKKRFYISRKRRIGRMQIRKWFVRKESAKYNLYKSKSLEIYAKYPTLY